MSVARAIELIIAGGIGDGRRWRRRHALNRPARRLGPVDLAVARHHHAAELRHRTRPTRLAGGLTVIGMAAGELGQIIYAITSVSLRQQICADRMLGRVNATPPTW